MDYKKQIGISTNIFSNPANVVDIIGLLALHFKKIEIEIDGDLKKRFFESNDFLADDCQTILNLAKQYNLDLSMHAPYIGYSTDIANKDDEIREKAVDLFIKVAEVANKLNIKKVTIHPGYIDNYISHPETLLHLKKSLAKLNEVAKANDILFLLENTGDKRPKYILLSDEEHIGICQEYSNIFLTLDIVHLNSFATDADAKNRLQKLLPYIKNAHFADMQNQDHRHLPLGQGNFDFESIIKFMTDNGHTENFIIEETGGRYKSYEYVDAAINYIKQ